MRQISTLLIIFCLTLTGCQSAYYSAMEKVGVHKREILVDRIEEAQGSQKEVQQEFKTALERFRSVVQFDGGDLEQQYQILQESYDDAKQAADDVSAHIEKIEDVAEALFVEWDEELELYSNDSLRRKSASKLATTKRQYQKLIQRMRKTEQKLTPFLSTLNDNVLYLKHNLNASAISALKGELKGIQNNVKSIIADINSSIAESDKFIQSLK